MMKLKMLLAALLLAGLGASIAFAAPRSDGHGDGKSTVALETGTGATTGTTTGTTTGKHDEGGEHGNKGKKDKPGCRNAELKGTIANGTVTLTTKSGQTVSLSISGKASVNARLCSTTTGSAATYQVRVLKVEEHPAPTVPIGTTTTTTTTTITTHP